MKLTRALINELEKPFLDDIPMSLGDAVLELHEAGVDLMTQEKPRRSTAITAIRYGLWLLDLIDQEALKEARKSRTLFYFLGDSYGIAQKGMEKSHFEWTQELRLAASYTDMVLGHIDSFGVYLYTAEIQRVHQIILPRIVQKCLLLVQDCDVNPELQVFNGDEKLGSLKELLQL